MATYDYDLGVIGGGAAGLTVAAGAAQLGARVLLVEKDGRLGGDCLHYGCVPSKTLIKTARVYHLVRNARRYGLPEASVGPVEFRAVAERIRGVIATIQRHDSEERFCGLGVRVAYGEPGFVDEHEVSWGQGRASAAKWVLATGSSPAVPEVPGLREAGYLTNRELFSLGALPASLVVLGGGPIAIEMAQAFCRLGSRVTVVQRSGQILSREDRDMAEAVQAALEGEGVSFLLEASVKEVRRAGGLKEVVVVRAGREEVVRAADILVALGRRANVEGLRLENAGVAVGKKGVTVDARLRTSAKHIFAAGDVTGEHQFTHAAGYEGGVVVANAVFRLPRKADYTWLPWCTYADPELASIGLNESRAHAAGHEIRVVTEEFRGNDRALAEGESAGKLKLVLDEKERPLGVQILGLHAGELLGEWSAVLSGGVKLTGLAGAVHAYPTLAEISKRVAGTYLSDKIFSDKVRKILHLLFQTKGRACGPGPG